MWRCLLLFCCGCYVTETGKVQSAFQAGATGGGSGSRCNASTCSGCCDSNGVCQMGSLDTHCGRQGDVCDDCTSRSTTCSTSGVCLDSALGREVLVRGADTFAFSGTTQKRSLTGVELHVERDGGFEVLRTPAALPDGTVRFSAVPPGRRFLFTGSEWIVGVGAEVDLSRTTLERQNVAFTDGGAFVTLELSGLEPWEPGSSLQLYVPSANVWADGYERGASGPLVSGTQVKFDHLVGMGGTSAPLPEDEPAWLSVMTPFDAGVGIEARVANRTASLPSFSVRQGGGSATPATFRVGTPMPLSMTWRVREGWTPISGLIDFAGTASHTFTVSQQPFAADGGNLGASGDLLSVSASGFSLPDELQLRANADSSYPSAWPRVITVTFCGATTPFALDGGVGAITPSACVVSQFLEGDARPTVPVPLEIQLDGVRLMGQPSNPPPPATVRAGGTLTWRAMGVGSTEVRSFSLDASGRWRRVSSLLAGKNVNSVVLPPGFLVPGRPGFLRVISHRQEGPPVSPYRSDYPAATADVPTAVFHVE